MTGYNYSIYEVNLLFSGNKYPTANVFFPLICEISFSLHEWMKSSIDEISIVVDLENFYLTLK